MIVITKNTYLEGGLFARGLSIITEYSDAMKIDSVLEDDFPVFDLTTEDDALVAEKRVGEFAMSFSFLESAVTLNRSDNIKDFFRAGTRDYRFHVVVEMQGFTFSGAFANKDVTFDFNLNKWQVKFIAKEINDELINYMSTLDTVFSFSVQQEISFEEYMSSYHLDFIDVTFPAETFSSKVGTLAVFQALYWSNTGAPGYTDWSNVSRWDTFKDLAKGLGFIYEVQLKYTAQEIYDTWAANTLSDLYRINIKWVNDILNEDPIVLTSAIDHKELTIPKSNQYIFIHYRRQVPDPAGLLTVIRGVLYDGSTMRMSDSDDGPGAPSNQAYLPYFQKGARSPNKMAYFPTSGDPITYDTTFINEIEMNYYSNPIIEAYGQYIRAGVIAYPRFFVCQGNGFNPIQTFVVQQYNRFLNATPKKGKELVLSMRDTTGIKNFKRLRFDDGEGMTDYYVTTIRNINVKDQTLTVDAIEI